MVVLHRPASLTGQDGCWSWSRGAHCSGIEPVTHSLRRMLSGATRQDASSHGKSLWWTEGRSDRAEYCFCLSSIEARRNAARWAMDDVRIAVDVCILARPVFAADSAGQAARCRWSVYSVVYSMYVLCSRVTPAASTSASRAMTTLSARLRLHLHLRAHGYRGLYQTGRVLGASRASLMGRPAGDTQAACRAFHCYLRGAVAKNGLRALPGLRCLSAARR